MTTGVPRAAALAVASWLLLAGAACGERAEPTGATVPLYPVTLQGAGGEAVTVEREPRRIAALAGAPARILTRLGAGDRIVAGGGGGRPRVVSPSGHVLLERLEGLRPDVLVSTTVGDPTAAIDSVELARAARATGAPVYVAPGDSLDDVERAVTELGLLAGRPLAARAIVRSLERRRRAVARRVGRRRKVSVFVDVGSFTTVSDRSLIGDLVREAGGRNVAGTRPDPRPVDLEALARLNPQVYLATAGSGTTLRYLRRNRKTRRLRAVRNRRFDVVRDELVRPDPAIGRGLEAIARILHPDAFR